jgi:hypothetical protein
LTCEAETAVAESPVGAGGTVGADTWLDAADAPDAFTANTT